MTLKSGFYASSFPICVLHPKNTGGRNMLVIDDFEEFE